MVLCQAFLSLLPSPPSIKNLPYPIPLGRPDTQARRKGEEASSPLRVFCLRSLKSGPKKNYLAPATQAIERATKRFILNTYVVITLSLKVLGVYTLDCNNWCTLGVIFA